MVISLLGGCIFDDGDFTDCLLASGMDCDAEPWTVEDPADRPGAAFELRAGAGLGDVSVHLVVDANNPSADQDCLVAVYTGDAEPDPTDLVPLDATVGAPETLGAARLVGAANLAHEWGTDPRDDTTSWDTGAGDLEVRDPDDLRVALNWDAHAPVHAWVLVATCPGVAIEGTTNAWVEYGFAVLQDPLYRFRLDQAW